MGRDKFLTGNDRYVYHLAIDCDLSSRECIIRPNTEVEATVMFISGPPIARGAKLYENMTGKDWVGVEFDFLRKMKAAIVMEYCDGYVVVRYFSTLAEAEADWDAVIKS